MTKLYFNIHMLFHNQHVHNISCYGFDIHICVHDKVIHVYTAWSVHCKMILSCHLTFPSYSI